MKGLVKKLLLVIIFFVFPSFIFAQSPAKEAQKSEITQQDAGDVLMFYYQKPQPDKLLDIIRMTIGEGSVSNDEAHFAPFRHFVAAVARKDAVFFEKLKEMEKELPESSKPAMESIIEEADNFHSVMPILPNGLALLLAEFTATGDEDAIKKIIDVLDYSQEPANTKLIDGAKNSLSFGALMHSKIHDLLREAHKSSQGVKKERLQEILGVVDAQIRYYHGRYGYSDQKFVDEKVERLNQTVEANPQDANNYLSRGIAFANNHDIDHALPDFLKALELNPKLPVAHNYVCWIYVQQGRLDEAQAHCEKALELTQNFGAPHYNLATIYLKKKDYWKALEHANKAVEFEPNNFDRYLLRAGIYEEQGDYASAIKDLKKAIDFHPPQEPFIKERLKEAEKKLDSSITDIVKQKSAKNETEKQ